MKIAVSSLLLLVTLVECRFGSNMRIFGIGSSKRTATVDLCNGVNGPDESVYEECDTLVAEEASCPFLHQLALHSQSPPRAAAARHLLHTFHCPPPPSPSPRLVNEPICGQSPALRTREPLIKGPGSGSTEAGEETANCSVIPWQVYLADGRWMCGGTQDTCAGSLISKDHVLTSARCVFELSHRTDFLNVTVGKHRRSAPGAEEQAVRVKSITLHPSYSRLDRENDIAIVTLQESLEFNECVSPICLDSTFTPDGHACIVSGWGTRRSRLSDVLRIAKVETYQGDSCDEHFTLGFGFHFRRDVKNLLCAGYTQEGADACEGDSGGPLVCWHGGRYVQTGVVNYGRDCSGRRNTPGFYSIVASYKDWIHSVTGIQS